MKELSGWFFCNYFVEQCSMRGPHYSPARVALRLLCMSINKSTANKASGVGQKKVRKAGLAGNTLGYRKKKK